MKRIFYYTDVLPFLSRGEDAIKKLKHNLNIFKESSEKVTLVWHPWSGTMEYLKLNNSEIIGEYLSIVDEYKNAGWGEYDETKGMEEAKKELLTCDAYYGDVCDLIYEAQNDKMPVMISNVDMI